MSKVIEELDFGFASISLAEHARAQFPLDEEGTLKAKMVEKKIFAGNTLPKHG